MPRSVLSRVSVIGVLGGAAILLGACQPPGSQGFTLPEGDPSAGQQTFTLYGCQNCHTVSDVAGLRSEAEEYERTIPLGGEKTRTYTYGELVTSIINPSHKISQRYLGDQVAIDGVSQMQDYNDVLTVSDLIDLVAFLEANYSLQDYTRTQYYPYGPM